MRCSKKSAQCDIDRTRLSGAITGAAFHDPDRREADADVEVWMSAPETFTPGPTLTRERLPKREVLIATLHGSHEGVPAATAALGAHNLATGPMFNIRRVGPAQTSDTSEWATDRRVHVNCHGRGDRV
ncbi:hypothetical protein I6B53_06955 [Schaalia sp. 19OD2882]|uniref:hypothetical protein n=1 Tax=Schaalia sp. 19OD2882 TaxID=2794089 RepID=UPI001C1F1C12|nr:hypothetical protein [Schaalia sp. 19OD2882]QWW18886.1 hypothetical protein I6B53_06955 [Schaalia sp. 19OD2882]